MNRTQNGAWPVCASLGVLLLLAAVPTLGQLRVVAWNTYHKPYSSTDANWTTVLSAMAAEDAQGIVKRPAVLALTELGTSRDPESNPPSGAYIEAICDNLWGGTYVRSQIHAGSYEDYAFIYDTTQVQLVEMREAPAGYRPTQYGRFRPLGYGADADFHVYNVHLKAYPSYEVTRHMEIYTTIWTDAMVRLPADAHVMYVGDFNLTTTGQEGAYTEVTAGSHSHVAFDPHGPQTAPGYYGSGGNGFPAPNEAYCTYSSSYAWSRIDFQFPSLEFADGAGVDLIDGTYRVFGNVGGLPDPMECWAASDHFAVVADYQVPAKLGVAISAPARVLIGSAACAEVTVQNAADVVAPNGADELDYAVIGSGDLSGTATGVDAALGGGVTHPIAYDTGATGSYSGQIVVTSSSPGVPINQVTDDVQYQVLDHSEASFAIDSNLDSRVIDLGAFHAGSGLQQAQFDIHNLLNTPGYTADLDILSATGVGDVSRLYTNVAAGTITPGGSRTYFAALDTNGAPGRFSATWTIAVSDDTDLFGAMPGTSLSLELHGYVGIDGDLDLSGVVNDDDLGILLGAWGTADPVADLTGDGVVNDDDLGVLLGNWGASAD
ncbi:MAG: hypothetical protein PVJ57_09225 [Phycisphaerae bacterium]|jgi:hypothetical protein